MPDLHNQPHEVRASRESKPMRKKARSMDAHDKLRQEAIEMRIRQLRIDLFTLFPRKLSEVSRMVTIWGLDSNRNLLGRLSSKSVMEGLHKAITSNDALTLLDLIWLGVALPGFQGMDVSLKVLVCGEEIGMAAVAVACAMLMDSVGADMVLERLEMRIVPLATVLFGNAIRYRQIWSRLYSSMKALLRRNLGLRSVVLNCPQEFTIPDLQGDLERVATSASQETRMAVLLGTHRRIGADSILRMIPLEVLNMILEKCAPKVPSRVQVLNGGCVAQAIHYGEDLGCIIRWVQ